MKLDEKKQDSNITFTLVLCYIRVFLMHKQGNSLVMPIMAAEALLHENKKNLVKNFRP